MFQNTYGLDLGTYEIKIYDDNTKKVTKVKDALAIQGKNEVVAYGDEAYEMFERTPADIEIVFPMKESVISKYNDMQFLLSSVIKQKKSFLQSYKYMIAIPSDVTEVEKRAFYELMMYSSARARKVTVVERGVADALGMGLNIGKSVGIFVANLGAETAELSVLSYGGIVLNKLIKRGGYHFDYAIQAAIKNNYDFLIGRTTAEKLRREFGVFNYEEKGEIPVSGRNLMLGVPQIKEIPYSLVRAAIRESLSEWAKEIRSLLDRTPPDLLRIILEEGIYITGGMACMDGMDEYLSKTLEIPVNVADKPDQSTVLGLAKIMHQKKDLEKFTYSMSEGNYRWIK